MPTSFSDVVFYSRPGGEGFVPEIPYRHFASGMIWTVEFKRLIAEALCEGFLENRTTSDLGSLRERPLLVAKSAIILLWSLVA